MSEQVCPIPHLKVKNNFITLSSPKELSADNLCRKFEQRSGPDLVPNFGHSDNVPQEEFLKK